METSVVVILSEEGGTCDFCGGTNKKTLILSGFESIHYFSCVICNIIPKDKCAIENCKIISVFKGYCLEHVYSKHFRVYKNMSEVFKK